MSMFLCFLEVFVVLIEYVYFNTLLYHYKWILYQVPLRLFFLQLMSLTQSA